MQENFAAERKRGKFGLVKGKSPFWSPLDKKDGSRESVQRTREKKPGTKRRKKSTIKD